MREPYRRHAQDTDEPLWQCSDPGLERRLQCHCTVPLPSREHGNQETVASRGSAAAGVPRKYGNYSNAVNSSSAGPAMTPPTSVSSMPRNTIGRAGPSDQPC